MNQSKKLFTPTWYTIPEFADRIPLCMYHKEAAGEDLQQETVKNLHVLARAHVRTEKDQMGQNQDQIRSQGQNPVRQNPVRQNPVSRSQADQPRRVLRITADDYYKLYVNGEFLMQGPAPAYPEAYYYNEIDLTPFLRDGDNVIAVHLYYQGLVNRVWNSGDGRFGVAAELRSMSGTESEKIPADEPREELSWCYQISHAYSGETTGYETQFLENFDSRKWDCSWNLPEIDDSGWPRMVPARWADYRLTLQPTKNLQCYSIKPALIRKRENGWFVDAGREVTGGLRIRAKGPSGSRIIICCGEELWEENNENNGNNGGGEVRWQMRCGCTCREVWTLNGSECEREPYDYKGFRYGQLTAEAGAEILDVEVMVRHYPMDETACQLTCSDTGLEDIFRICKNAVRLGTQEGYLDCPTREKGQYLGDAVVTSNAQVWLTGSAEMLEKAIRQFALTCRLICPGMMGVAPGAFMQEIADFSLLWSQLLLHHYRFTGDRNFLEEMYPTAKGILDHFRIYEREDGLLEQVADKWNLVDWPENLRDQYDFPLTRPVVAPGCHNVINALYVGAAKTLSRIEELLGKTKSYDWKKLRDAYWKTFYRPETGLLADSETSSHSAVHSNLYALYFGLIPEKEHEAGIAEYLVKRGFACGVFASYFMLKGLAGAGYYEDVYRLMVNESEHGWLNMVREGATCCYEAWGKDQKWNTSLCHPWASAPVSVLIEEIAGFCPDPAAENGWRFQPHIPESVERLELRVPFRGRSYVVRKEDGKVWYSSDAGSDTAFPQSVPARTSV